MEVGRPSAERFFRENDRAQTMIIGLVMGKPPETFAELNAVHEASRACPVSEYYEPIIRQIESSQDPDAVVRGLPYDEDSQSVLFRLAFGQTSEPISEYSQ